jgi:hypothetical protein
MEFAKTVFHCDEIRTIRTVFHCDEINKNIRTIYALILLNIHYSNWQQAVQINLVVSAW